MLNILKFDLYNITKSKILRLYWVLPLLLAMVRPILTYAINKDNWISVFSHLFSGGELHLSVLVFSCLLCCRDYSSGFIKNLYNNTSKEKYVISKLICISLFCVVYAIVIEILIDFIFNLIFGAGVLYSYERDKELFLISGFLLNRLTYILSGIVIGAVIMFFSTLIKKEYIVVTIFLIYLLLLSGYVQRFISELERVLDISLIKYLIFRLPAHGGWFNDYVFRDLLLPHIIFPLLYITLFTLLSYLILKKRNV